MDYVLFVGAKFEQTSRLQGDVGMLQITGFEVRVNSNQPNLPEVIVSFVTQTGGTGVTNLRQFAPYLKALDFVPTNKSFILGE